LRPFEQVIVVDWSAASQPSPARPSADAIWIGAVGEGTEEVSYHRTRHLAERALEGMLRSRRRTLIGFDFPMGYPAGFAARLTGEAGARAVWDWLADHVEDAPDNRNNRFQVAGQINRALGGAGPFWGCPASIAIEGLSPKKTVDYAKLGISERRAVEKMVPRAQPVWKLYTTGSVGSQALMGLPVVRRLGLPVWPFDPLDDVMMVAEIYPSLLGAAVAKEGGIKDAAQVRLLARALWRLSRTGQLPSMFAVPQTAREEGWILGAGQADLLTGALA
jgi:hypothetical protein